MIEREYPVEFQPVVVGPKSVAKISTTLDFPFRGRRLVISTSTAKNFRLMQVKANGKIQLFVKVEGQPASEFDEYAHNPPPSELGQIEKGGTIELVVENLRDKGTKFHAAYLGVRLEERVPAKPAVAVTLPAPALEWVEETRMDERALVCRPRKGAELSIHPRMISWSIRLSFETHVGPSSAGICGTATSVEEAKRVLEHLYEILKADTTSIPCRDIGPFLGYGRGLVDR